MFTKIRNSSVLVSQLSDHVFICENNINNVGKLLTKDEIDKWSHSTQSDTGLLTFNSNDYSIDIYNGMNYETRFNINFICIIDILNFASGFRHELHNFNSKGAYSNIHSGVVSLSNDSPFNLFANQLKDISLEKIKHNFNLNTDDITISKLCKMIQKVLQETGIILEKMGKKDFAEFIWDETSNNKNAENLVEKLVDLFPGFRDIHKYKGKDIYIIKKAQLLCADLFRHFHTSFPSRFNFTDISNVTIMSDNVIPAVLRKFGIIKLSKELEEYIDSANILQSGDKEIELRSVSIHACDLLCKAWMQEFPDRSENINIMNLDFYLWCKGKDPEFRKVERHYTQDTIYY